MNHIVHAKIQKWGNSLGIRISGLVREITQFEPNAEITIEVFEGGFTVKKVAPQQTQLFFSEAELLDDITESNTHSDLLASPTASELGLP